MARWALGREYASADLLPALCESVQYWQAILRLQDWNVVLSIRRRSEMSLKEAIGCNTVSLNHKDCLIEVVDPDDLYTFHARYNGEELDYEITLVHELLHLHFAPFDADEETNPHGNTYQELAINTLARALVALDRK